MDVGLRWHDLAPTPVLPVQKREGIVSKSFRFFLLFPGYIILLDDQLMHRLCLGIETLRNTLQRPDYQFVIYLQINAYNDCDTTSRFAVHPYGD